MPFSQVDGIRYYKFDLFPEAVTHAVFTRQGGVSPSPWDTLNVGGTVGDDPVRVRENRIRSFSVVGRRLESMFDVWQVHSADLVAAEAPRNPEGGYQKADIIFTDRPEVTLFMRFADCVPIFLYDQSRGVVGLVHAGWLGTVRGAVSEAIHGMTKCYGSKPADILSAIGPSIGVDHYEIGQDVQTQIEQVFGSDARQLMQKRGENTYLDLWETNRIQLLQSGVEQIEVAGLCTACNLHDWFSHRAEKGKTGRFGALIALG
jgi:YfiH family protein